MIFRPPGAALGILPQETVVHKWAWPRVGAMLLMCKRPQHPHMVTFWGRPWP